MSKIIAGTYEILYELGSGGGGIVYLGRHLRLGKQIVLKADKRKLNASAESLRREVDALKNLSHTYIPQVYDFVVEGEDVYTVMDYIEGESLDKALEKGVRVRQSTVITWACQLLEALHYLHSQPPHGILHADIKPSNIMLTPQGDIRLIDFNIALALGEEGAVRVGSSRGYASPEHYGIDYRAGAATHFDANDVETQFTAETPETQYSQHSHSGTHETGSSKAQVLLDVRSDIYSLGATLYHLLCGRRPDPNAVMVAPLTTEYVSPQISAIIAKAMAPNPAQRYQTAAEMLYALRHLYEGDVRIQKFRRHAKITAAALGTLFLLGGWVTFSGLQQMKQAEEAARLAAEAAERTERMNKAALNAVVQSENSFRMGDRPTAIAYAMEALENETPYAAQARKALTDALGVYDLSNGFQNHLTIQLPSEPIKVQLSPNGTHAAVLVSGQVLIYDCESGTQLAALDADPSAQVDICFVQEDRLLYGGAEGICLYDLTEEKQLWSGNAATGIALSTDGNTAAAVYKDQPLVTIYDAVTGAVRREIPLPVGQVEAANDILADPQNELLALNRDGSLLGLSFADGGLKVYDVRSGEEMVEIYDASAFTHFEGGFREDIFAFSATGEGESVFAALDMAAMAQTGGFASTMPFHVQTRSDGVYLSNENILVKIDPYTGEQTEVAYTEGTIALYDTTDRYAITVGEALTIFDRYARPMQTISMETPWDDLSMAGDYAALTSFNTPVLRLLRVRDHADAQIFAYDGDYAHYEARINEQGETIMLFRTDGFRIYSMAGEILAETELPDHRQIYDQQFRRTEDGCWLEVIYYDGRVVKYSANSGEVMEETTIAPPDDSLYEEFFTDKWRIESPLHGQPLVYDRETGEQIGELESDAYLSYVTQVDDYVITEYISSEGKRYGLLLNDQCEVLAELPNLCDILPDGRLVFDDMVGNLRQCRIYSLQELKELAEK